MAQEKTNAVPPNIQGGNSAKKLVSDLKNKVQEKQDNQPSLDELNKMAKKELLGIDTNVYHLT